MTKQLDFYIDKDVKLPYKSAAELKPFDIRFLFIYNPVYPGYGPIFAFVNTTVNPTESEVGLFLCILWSITTILLSIICPPI